MILVAGGDSFVYGAELVDQINGPSMSTFPALLANKNNLQYHCAAWPGNSNNAITRMLISVCEEYKKQNKKIIVLVAWTFTNRYEFRFNYNTGQKISPWHSVNSWSIVDDTSLIEKEFHSKNDSILNYQRQALKRAKATGINDFAKIWFKHVGDNEYYELYSSLKEICFLQYYLEQNKFPFLFLTADNVFYEHENYFRSKDIYIESLYNQIDWNKWFFFSAGTKPDETQYPRGFYQWAVENKYPMGTTHPLEQAHIAASILIEEKFNELVNKSLE
jgi:hypothetical protein